jgi:hypothetical protein
MWLIPGWDKYHHHISLSMCVQSNAAAAASDDLFEEVWKLTGKFYFDRSFGGHDWDKVNAA